MSRTAIVVGGGLAGLAAAVELTTAGVKVTVVERNAHLGGKMNVLDEAGFRFDMGPTILTMPQVVRGIIARSGRRPEDYLSLVRLDPQWRCLYEDGTRVDLLEDVGRMAAAMDRQFPGRGAGEGWRRFIDWSRRMYRLSDKVFFYKDLGGIVDLMRKPPANDPGLLGCQVGQYPGGRVVGQDAEHPAAGQALAQVQRFAADLAGTPFAAAGNQQRLLRVGRRQLGQPGKTVHGAPVQNPIALRASWMRSAASEAPTLASSTGP